MKDIIIDDKIIQLDDEDFEFITECYNIHIDKQGYVQCRVKKKFKNMGLFTRLSLHKLLINPYKTGRKINVDHIDGDKLNNQKSNLRLCTHAENMRNRRNKKIEDHHSKYKGVSWHKRQKKWIAIISYEYKLINIGSFNNEIAAANAYNYHALKLYGDFALLNNVPFMTVEEWKRDGFQKTSQYRGVSFIENRWVAQIWDGKRNLVLGRFKDEKEAALAYNQKAIELKGNKAKLNIIHNEN